MASEPLTSLLWTLAGGAKGNARVYPGRCGDVGQGGGSFEESWAHLPCADLTSLCARFSHM